ncbi:MAG: ArgE/DapE family deacylase [Beijerinckiaceae bacterium]
MYQANTATKVEETNRGEKKLIDPVALRQRIRDQRNETIDLLCQLVRFPSITGQEAEIGAFVADFCRSLGLAVEIVSAQVGRPNVIARWDSGHPGPTLLLNDHLDIVPPGPLELWHHPPFEPLIVDGHVVGRGTIDTKAGLTTLLMSVCAARNIGMPIVGRLVMIFTCDEEVAGQMGMQFLGAQGLIEGDMALVAEPTTMGIEIATKGRLGFDITTAGLATHGARPWLGHNAIDDMTAILTELQGLAATLDKRTHPRMGRASLNVGRIEGGTVANMVPNWCRAEVDRRLLPDETRESAVAEIEAAIDHARQRRPGLSASLEQKLWWPGYMLDETEPLIQIAADAYEKVVGRQPRIGVKDAGTDASWIYNFAKIPVVMFSPGDGLRAMNANESVAIDDMMLATEVVGQIIADVLMP